MRLRIVFMGTPVFSVPALQALIAAGHQIAAVYTQPPRPSGRGLELTKSPIQVVAEKTGLPVRTPVNLRDPNSFVEFQGFAPDMVVVVAYGLILPRSFIEFPRHYCLNLHASLLPRWRGAAPIQRAVMAGDLETGVMVMKMEEGLDTGPFCLCEKVEIGREATSGELHDRLAELGAKLLIQAVELAENGKLAFTEQRSDGVTYAAKIKKSEARINWKTSAQNVHDQIRGLSPFPGAYFEFETDRGMQRIKILQSRVVEGTGQPGTVLDENLTVACGESAIQILELQRPGKGVMSAAEYLRGNSLARGHVLE